MNVRNAVLLRNQSYVCSAQNEQDAHAIFYKMSPNDELLTPVGEQYTIAFLLTRGKFSWIGFEWAGCRSTYYPRPQSWDVDYGVPLGNCSASGNNGTFVRRYTKAIVAWDCNTGLGNITMH